MEKKSRIVAAGLVSLLFVLGSASAQSPSYLVQEGKQLKEVSQYLVEQGQIMEKCTCMDKAALLAQGDEMVQKGNDVLSQAMMMRTDEGRSGNGELGKKIMAAGNLLNKKGNQAGPLTGKDKAEVNTLGKNLVSLGSLKLQQAKVMCGE